VTRRSAPLLAVLLTLSVLLAGCGGGSGTASGGYGSSGGAGAGTSTSQASGGTQGTPGAATADCPTGGNTKDFAKTRFVLHAAEGFGVFHRYLYKPYRNGAFGKGASGRIRTFLKAGAAVTSVASKASTGSSAASRARPRVTASASRTTPPQRSDQPCGRRRWPRQRRSLARRMSPYPHRGHGAAAAPHRDAARRGPGAGHRG